jgi:hypothetical protein
MKIGRAYLVIKVQNIFFLPQNKGGTCGLEKLPGLTG